MKKMGNTKICGIYKITSPTKRVYIGQSIDIENLRLRAYSKESCKNQPKLFNSIKKYGWETHFFEIIEECEIGDLNCRERFWQDYYDVLNGGLNCILTNCGDEKTILSEDTKNKIRLSLAEYFDNLGKNKRSEIYGVTSRGRKGEKGNRTDYTWSEDSKNKLSSSLKGHVVSDKTKQKIREKMLGRDITWGDKISKSNKGKPNYKNRGKNTKSINQYTLENVFIRTWKSIKEASENLNIPFNSISNALCGYSKTGYGFKWSYNTFDLDNLVKKNWLYVSKHPNLPLNIYNYTNKVQHENLWGENNILLDCRALVTDENGSVVSKGFPKFFNYSEGKTKIPDKIDWVRVYEKLDGSYIGLFWYKDEWIVNSKGSFASEQVGWAKEILISKDLNSLNEELTYCFELIVPENRIVVDYGDIRDLVFLTAFDNSTGLEVSLLQRPKQFNLVPLYFSENFNPQTLKDLNSPNEEGFVIRFSNGERCKIKFEEYIKLHSLYTRTSSYDIWNCLKNGDDITKIIEEAPDEIYDWIDKVVEDIKIEYIKLDAKIKGRYFKLLGDYTNKEFAEKIMHNKYKHYLFSLRNNRDISEQIWKDVKPKYKTYGK